MPNFPDYKHHPKGRAERMVNTAKYMAKKRGIPFMLTKSWVRRRLEKGVCEITGVRFDLKGGAGGACQRGPSIDRIDRDIGYYPGNCRVVLWAYNAFKGSGTDQEAHKLFVEWARKAL